MKKFDMKEFIKDLNKNEFVRECGIPLGYKAGYPIVKNCGGEVLLIVPFKKTRRTKEPGVSVVLPIEYTVTFALHAALTIPESIKKATGKEAGYSGAAPAGFETLKYSKKFEKVDFTKPADVFPHDELKAMGKEEYAEKVEKINAAYNAVINDMLGIEKAAGIDKVEFKQLLNVLIAPVTKLLYKLIDEEFYADYIA